MRSEWNDMAKRTPSRNESPRAEERCCRVEKDIGIANGNKVFEGAAAKNRHAAGEVATPQYSTLDARIQMLLRVPAYALLESHSEL